MPDSHRHPPAGLPRRLAALVYDGLLVLGLLVIPTLAAIAIRGGESIPPGSLLFQLLLFGTAGGFFVWFWTHGGQTLGMRSWQLRVERQSGGPLSYRDALLRFGVGIVSIAAAGLGLLWILIDPDKLAWHDRAAGTRVVTVPKIKK
ncbi:MAG: RDD family protein [Gammaproteobacteria bacterium]